MILRNNEVHLNRKSLTGIANLFFSKDKEKALLAVIKRYPSKRVYLDGVLAA